MDFDEIIRGSSISSLMTYPELTDTVSDGYGVAHSCGTISYQIAQDNVLAQNSYVTVQHSALDS